jgi:hypothetical protein
MRSERFRALTNLTELSLGSKRKIKEFEEGGGKASVRLRLPLLRKLHCGGVNILRLEAPLLTSLSVQNARFEPEIPETVKELLFHDMLCEELPLGMPPLLLNVLDLSCVVGDWETCPLPLSLIDHLRLHNVNCARFPPCKVLDILNWMGGEQNLARGIRESGCWKLSLLYTWTSKALGGSRGGFMDEEGELAEWAAQLGPVDLRPCANLREVLTNYPREKLLLPETLRSVAFVAQ